MPKRPLVIVHGYSDKGESFRKWKDILVARCGYSADQVHICSYRSLTNEITIKDIAEGFDRALKLVPALRDGAPFDAMVHSTGMLVVRSWLTQYGAAKAPLRNLIALAPATFGSPLAHKGRSFLGSIFKGSKSIGSPDFMEAGNEVLYGLELGGSFTWDLAHRDLFSDEVFYGPTRKTPCVFTFCGDRGYGGLQSLVNEPGTDGTVRWAGCALNSRKFVIDLTARRDGSRRARTVVVPMQGEDSRLIPIAGLHHGTIVSNPSDELIGFVRDALAVGTAAEYQAFNDRASAATKAARAKMKPFQQFVIRAVDERGDPIPDWNATLFRTSDGGKQVREFATDVHVYSRDKSLRCFHVDLGALGNATDGGLLLRVIASTGTAYVSYSGVKSEIAELTGEQTRAGHWDAQLEVPATVKGTTLFYPFTTTLIELVLNREPTPLGDDKPNEVTRWV
ncbi:MAG: hypothetical protein FJ202_00170 [Gemmatimonadetes bacterium]|nr:hypothetical protein [Gemmatimonadota bacterium]